MCALRVEHTETEREGHIERQETEKEVGRRRETGGGGVGGRKTEIKGGWEEEGRETLRT